MSESLPAGRPAADDADQLDHGPDHASSACTASRGPKGGELAPVGKTGLLAELVRKRDGKPALTVVEADRPPPTRRRGSRCRSSTPSGTRAAGRASRAAPSPSAAGRTRSSSRPRRSKQLDLRTTADWVIRPRLLKIPGIAEVIVMGGDRKQYQVLVDPTALPEYDVTLQEVEAGAQGRTTSTPAAASPSQGETERPIRVIGRLGPRRRDRCSTTCARCRSRRRRTAPSCWSRWPASTRGRQLKRGDASINGRPGVVITIVKQPHADTRDADRRGHGGAARGRGRRCRPTSSSTPTCSS